MGLTVLLVSPTQLPTRFFPNVGFAPEARRHDGCGRVDLGRRNHMVPRPRRCSDSRRSKFTTHGQRDRRGPGLVAVGFAGVFEVFQVARQSWTWIFVGGAAVWTSVDGTTWYRVTNDAAVFGGAFSQQVNSVTTGSPGLVAVGTARSEGTMDFRSAVWTSVDGITWSRAPDDETVIGGDDLRQINDDGTPRRRGAEMTSVTIRGPALVAVGHVAACCFDGGASDAAVWIATPVTLGRSESATGEAGSSPNPFRHRPCGVDQRLRLASARRPSARSLGENTRQTVWSSRLRIQLETAKISQPA